MTRILTDGFEHQRVASGTGSEYNEQVVEAVTPNVTITGTCTIDTSTPRSGAACLSCAASAINRQLYPITTVVGRTYYYHFGFRFNAAPSTTSVFFAVRDGTGQKVVLQLNTNRTIRMEDQAGTLVASGTTTLSVDTYYTIELAVNVPTSGNGAVNLRINGTDEPNLSGLSIDVRTNTAITTHWLGHNTSGDTASTFKFDDFIINDDQGSVDNSYVGLGHKIIWLAAVSDSARTLWTRGDGTTTTGLFNDVDAKPAAGSNTPANNLQIRTTTTTGTGSYDAVSATYTSGGIGGEDSIVGIRAVYRGCGTSTTGTNDGSGQLVANPADGGATTWTTLFDTAAPSAVDGTTGQPWTSRASAWQRSATGLSVARGTGCTYRITKVTSSARDHYIDSMFVEVEYVDRAATLNPHAQFRGPQQAAIPSPGGMYA